MTRPPLPPPPPPPPLPSPVHETPAPSFHKFKIDNRELKTTVLSTESDITSHLFDFLSFISSDRQIKRIVGLDIETFYTSPDPSSSAVHGKVAVLKLCTGRRCLLIQLLHLKSVPSSLACFLNLPDLSFVGVGINRCLAALERDYGLGCRNAVDLVQLAATVKQKPYIGAFGVVDLANEVGISNVRLKEARAALSDWGSRSLNPEQVLSATVDVFMCFHIGNLLLGGIFL